MRRRLQPLARVLLVLLACASGCASATDDPHPPIVVYVDNVTAKDAPLIHGAGLLVDAMVNAGQKSEYDKIPLRYEVIRRALPDFDLTAAYRSALRCLPGPAAAEDCRDVVVYQGTSREPDPASATNPGALTRIDLMIGFRRPYAAMTFDFTFSELDPSTTGTVRKQFRFMYVEPVDSPNNGYPFADPQEGDLGPGETKARAYWFGGHPSRFETTLRNALEDFRQFTAMYYERAGGPDFDPTSAPWWKSLGQFGDLKANGKIKCIWNACKKPYLRAENGRIWFAPSVAGKPIQFYLSDSLSSWGGKSETAR